jgi:hypothetical protein
VRHGAHSRAVDLPHRRNRAANEFPITPRNSDDFRFIEVERRLEWM